jgi:hypothetical protein
MRTHAVFLWKRRNNTCRKVSGEVFAQKGEILKAPACVELLGAVLSQVGLEGGGMSGPTRKEETPQTETSSRLHGSDTRQKNPLCPRVP